VIGDGVVDAPFGAARAISFSAHPLAVCGVNNMKIYLARFSAVFRLLLSTV